MEALYIDYLDDLFKAEFKTKLNIALFTEGIGMNIERWVDVLIFIRKQARLPIPSGTDMKETVKINNRCKWIDQIYIPSIMVKIPFRIGLEVTDSTIKREAEQRFSSQKSV